MSWIKVCLRTLYLVFGRNTPLLLDKASTCRKVDMLCRLVGQSQALVVERERIGRDMLRLCWILRYCQYQEENAKVKHTHRHTVVLFDASIWLSRTKMEISHDFLDPKMSRRTAIVEEFDDDTELPLPSHPLPNTGDGPLLEEIQDLDYEIEPSPRAGPASAQFRSSSTADQSGGPNSTTATVISVEPYKKSVVLSRTGRIFDRI